MTRAEAEKLADLILEELRHPQDVQKVYDAAERLFESSRPLPEVLATKDRQHRRVFYLQSEERWFRLFGWTMAKALMLYGLLVGVAFLAMRGRMTPDQAVTLIFGASFFYLIVYLMSLRRYAKTPRKVEEVVSTYRSELNSILEELVRSHQLDPAKYKGP